MGRLNPCGQVAKVFLVAINMIYVLVGFILIGVGVAFFVEKDEFQVLTGDDNLIVGLGFIAGGVFTVLIAFLGVISAIGEISALLVVYGVLSVALILLEVASASICYVERDHITKNADKKFVEYMQQYRDASNASYSQHVNEIIDIVQSALRCCGSSGYTTWMKYNSDYVKKYGYPSSCECTVVSKSNCIALDNANLPSAIKSVWEKGCNETFYGAIGSNFAAFGGAGIAIGLVQMLTVSVALLLFTCIMVTRSRERHEARIRAAAYTQLDSYAGDNLPDDEHEELHAAQQQLIDSDHPTFTNDPEPDESNQLASGTLMSSDGTSSGFVTTRTLENELEPNDVIVGAADSDMYIK